MTLVPGEAAVSGVTVLGNATGQTRHPDPVRQGDRHPAGRPDHRRATPASPAAFSGGAAATVALTDGKLPLRIVVDGSSVEVFAGDGKAVISSLVFPAAGDDKVGAVRRRRQGDRRERLGHPAEPAESAASARARERISEKIFGGSVDRSTSPFVEVMTSRSAPGLRTASKGTDHDPVHDHHQHLPSGGRRPATRPTE